MMPASRNGEAADRAGIATPAHEALEAGRKQPAG